jgi:hydrogenase nickel incorporation protein HypA/HybF
MHELSIVQSIVDIAASEVKKHDATAVERIELQIGKLAGIDPQALDFAWEVAIIGTVLEKAARTIDFVKGRAKCLDCGIEYFIDEPFDDCPGCHSYRKEYKSGRELLVKSITILKQ